MSIQFGNAQEHNSYDSLWDKVLDLEMENLSSSALKQTEDIFEKAKKEGNKVQIIKALLYKSKFIMSLKEDSKLSIINDFKSEITIADEPTKQILHSHLAKLYWQYFQQNRHRFYNRTITDAKVDSVDFRTWDLDTIFKEIDYHFTASLEDANTTQQLSISDFDAILEKNEENRKYRPTLFDVLAHNALQFYTTSENSINKPADAFEIDNEAILCEAYTASFLTFDDRQNLSLQSRALEIYQQLVAFHFGNPDINPLVLIDIERLRFIHQNATFGNKDDLYLEVLKNSAENIKHSPLSGLYTYEIALQYQQLGRLYTSEGIASHQFKFKEAVALCDDVIARFPESLGAQKCQVLKSEIQDYNVQLTAEKYIPKNTIGRLLVNYKNVESLHLNAYKITQNQLSKLEETYPDSKKKSFIKNLPIAKTWSAQLKTENDYQSHSTEIIVPALENGSYILTAESNNEKIDVFSYTTIQATDVAVIESQTNRQQQYQIINRNNGKPIIGAEVILNYRKNYKDALKRAAYTTDKNGFITIEKSKENWNNINITVKTKNDKAHFGEYYVNRNYAQNNGQINHSCFLFTDRSIYRPGQPIYFKGIAISQDKGISKVLKKTNIDVTLSDVNGQEIETLSLTTNDYGSVSGEFILPNSGLTGQFSIRASSDDLNLNGYASISVEEYKRPKFETNFEPITDTFKVNDSITVTGKATAYAGSTISDAKVVYSVKRVVSVPRRYYWIRPFFNGTSQEIVQGETITDAAGNYKITFKAIPDNSVEKENLPTFNYEVTAEVTDINGETRSTTTTVNVGYHALDVRLLVPNAVDKTQKNASFNITSKNLNGQSVFATGEVKLYKLQAPDHVLRPRPWPAPDYSGFSKEEFKKLYPHEAFKNEDNSANWQEGKMVWQSKFDTEKSNEISFGKTKNWESGKYRMELFSKDKFGQEVKDIAIFSITGNEQTLADNQLFYVKTDKEQYSVGDKAQITFFSSAKNLNVTVIVEKDQKIFEEKVLTLNDNSKTITVPVTKDDLGGFAITYSYAFANHFDENTVNLLVPYPSSDLQIETMSFRDKIAPGVDETWSFKVKGPKGEKVSAELLASMYDASLDQFRAHSWNFNPISQPHYYSRRRTSAYNSFSTISFQTFPHHTNFNYPSLSYDTFDSFGLDFNLGNFYQSRSIGYNSGPLRKSMMADDALLEEVVMLEDSDTNIESNLAGRVAGVEISSSAPESKSELEPKTDKEDFDAVTIRKNLQETAFFFPLLQTDKEGNVSFNFTTPEALTRWNLQLLAHTKNLESTITNLTTVTQKELMVIPNAPRFLREGDEITISSKISNLTEKLLSGQAKLELTNAVTGLDISTQLLEASNTLETTTFEVDAMGNTQVSWRLNIPEGLQSVQYKILAKAGDFSDGEQNMLPVLSNRTLVTETLPMWVRSNQTKTFTLDKLSNTSSTTLKHHKLTLEMTSNPAWYAVQALPYLMEYPYDCNEQTFSRYYANTLASHIASSNPRIREVFDQWANSDALLSNLEKNEELKSLLIQETPWLRDAQSETEQKKRIGLLFNLNKMKNEQQSALNKLTQNQNFSGAWSWFNGGPDNRYITQYIISGMGHLNHLVTSATLSNQNLSTSFNSESEMIENAISYLDAEFVKEYEYMKKHTSNINDDHLSANQVHYLYMRSFFKDIKTSKKVDEITEYYLKQAQKYWTKRGLYAQGMLALVLHRKDDAKTSTKILRALEENSITSDELGMYWKSNTSSWFWYQAPIETQALLIEAFSEIRPADIETIDNLKIWLLKNKQTNQWSTTKATTEAVYALLLQGSEWLSVTDAVEVLVGGEKIDPLTLEDVKVEAGTGYFKTSWNTTEIEPKMGEVQIRKKGNGIAWGALYWQYFEDLDKITSAETPLKLKKKIFLKKNTDSGEVISEVTDNTTLKVGDLVKIRIELRSDRNMEFIHMKDMRAAGFEPVNVISRYKWQDGLGYYESTKDASTNFFFDYLPKGVYVFEYDVRVNNAGDFSNGITNIQSMYAPEFSSHSEGVRVSVEN
ncbi:alpha-2-macroglobulin family protein [Maribacter spongiicola]|uniref:Alpha-2-macroglobulin family protein n=1 Tax=Maribacter spongiicola TaxID=1206753 RepID=A0A4R7K6S9_9FLAO|nr:MG2 domain-containing protein [Maribacter spongiicola]TDT46987.1 alpha-2-macroglobulin family protein [Maribacter spongiicola]